MSNVLIIEDHAVVRMGMEMIISELMPKVRVIECDSYSDGLEIVKREPLDLLVLDIQIPGGEDIKMISTIRHYQPKVPILMFSAQEEEKYALRFVQAGADGFLPKHATKDQYREAVKTVLRKEKYISYSVQQDLLARITEKKPISVTPSWKGLSERENQVAQMLIEGLWTKEIAMQLNLKESTISTFKKKIFEKVGVTNSIDLARAFENH